MKILILNAGSSSIKYKLYKVNHEYHVLASGLVERIGLKNASIKQSVGTKEPVIINQAVPNHMTALQLIRSLLTHGSYGVLKDFSEINGIGHRVVHGGEKFSTSAIINEEVLNAIKECCDLAPLHNPPNLLGIEGCSELLPDVPQVAVFDTAFHQTMPPKAFLYGLAYNQYTKYKIRRYGFHGSSHSYVAREASKILKKDISELKLITAHLGNGCSLTAIKNGKSVDTSMGLTPLEGVVMGTRCGDVDPYVPLHLIHKEGLTLDETNELLNKKSGLLGLSGKRDMRDVLQQVKENDEMATLAIDVFCYRIAKYIGSYTAVMNGVDAIVFTAGIGENSSFVRSKILEYFDYLGLVVDASLNENNSLIITVPDSKVTVLVVPTNEELVIAQDTFQLIKNSSC